MKVTLKWPNHANAVITGLIHLFKEEFKTDFELSVNGCYIKAHQLILSIFCSRVKSEEKSTLILGEHSSLNKEDMQMLLAFIYTGQIDVERARLASLKELCRLMGFKELFDIISIFLKNKAVESRKVESRQSSTRNTKRIRQPVSYVNDDKEGNVCDNVNGSEPTQAEEKSEDSCDVNDGTNSESSSNSKATPKRKWKYQCEHCPLKTKRRCYMLMHMINKHQLNLEGNPITKTVKCPQCPKLFYTEQHVKIHMVSVHDEKRFICDLCGKRFPTKRNLEMHNKGIHSNVKPYMCETCGRRFKHPHNLREHNNTHLGTMANCEVCGESFRESYIRKHMKVKHSSEPKPHQCTLCSFETWKNWNLKIHLKNVHKAQFNDLNNSYKFEDFTG